MMKTMSGEEIVSVFLDFFQKRGHLRMEGASLLPRNDPSLLYINSGMAPLKPYFLGLATPPQRQLCDVQRCVRTNDIDSVGDRHHLTFFDMLGSWSIGDYWKEHAIELAWELLVEGFGFPRERLYATVYKGDAALGIAADDDSAKFWRAVGMPEDHIIRLGEDNFWGPAGQWGPCGPCTEVFFDTGEEFGQAYRPGGVFDDKSRYIEIWNAGVFMQYDKQSDGLRPLNIRSVDTGSGVERMAMAINGFGSCYETDLLKPLVDYARSQLPSDVPEKTLRVIADHARAATMILADGGRPSAMGAGYIPRRLIRRAVAAAAQTDRWDFDFAELVDLAIANAQSWNSHVPRAADRVRSTFRSEVEQFHKTLKSGLQRLAGAFEDEPHLMRGATAFKLFSTYGIPVDVIREYVVSRGGALDVEDFEDELRGHQALSRTGPPHGGSEPSRAGDIAASPVVPSVAFLENFGPTLFLGYEDSETTAEVLAIVANRVEVDGAGPSENQVDVVFDRTPFYAESGGQAGDIGEVEWSDGRGEILDTSKHGDLHVHRLRVTDGRLAAGMRVRLAVDADRRTRTRANHSAAHLLHAALRNVLGPTVSQKGQLVDSERVRFDFAHSGALAPSELERIEAEVNAVIRQNTRAETKDMAPAEAIEAGAIALFGEKYGDSVRVLTLGRALKGTGPYSVELCGGTHVSRTGDIALFKIVGETGVAAGVRRIEGLTGEAARRYLLGQAAVAKEIAEQFKVPIAEVHTRVDALIGERRKFERELAEVRKQLAMGNASGAGGVPVEEIAGLRFIAKALDGVGIKELRPILEDIKKHVPDGVVALAGVVDGKVAFAVGVAGQALQLFSAVDLVRAAVLAMGGQGGGGKPEFAQGGAPNGERASDGLLAVRLALEATKG